MADVKDFTQREMEIMAKAWNCMTSEPTVDFSKLAEACGMTNQGSAANAWRNIKKKIVAKAGIPESNGSEGTPKPTPKATPRKRGKKATDEDDAEESPTKKAKGRKGKAAKSETKVAEDDEVEEAEGSPVKAESGGEELN